MGVPAFFRASSPGAEESNLTRQHRGIATPAPREWPLSLASTIGMITRDA